MTIVSLFAGIGGLERGLELAGWGPVVAQVEIDPFCRTILARHWPSADRSQSDVTTAVSLPRGRMLCGGFPCQDVSSAGKGQGLAGERSGLWRHFARIAAEMRPELVVVENVASGGRCWLPFVRRDLHVLGYRARAVGISAFDCGAPHLRRRVFVLAADPERFELRDESRWSGGPCGEGASEPSDDGTPWPAPDADGEGQLQPEGCEPEGWRWSRDGDGAGWTAESPVPGVAHGVSDRLDRERALGNAVVPYQAYVAGRFLKSIVRARQETALAAE